MSDSHEQPRVETQSLTDTGLQVYESVATLEFAGRRPTRDALAHAVPLDQPALDDVLADLTQRGLLTAQRDSSDTIYRPARRDWSMQPQTGPGHQWS